MRLRSCDHIIRSTLLQHSYQCRQTHSMFEVSDRAMLSHSLSDVFTVLSQLSLNRDDFILRWAESLWVINSALNLYIFVFLCWALFYHCSANLVMMISEWSNSEIREWLTYHEWKKWLTVITQTFYVSALLCWQEMASQQWSDNLTLRGWVWSQILNCELKSVN